MMFRSDSGTTRGIERGVAARDVSEMVREGRGVRACEVEESCC